MYSIHFYRNFCDNRGQIIFLELFPQIFVFAPESIHVIGRNGHVGQSHASDIGNLL